MYIYLNNNIITVSIPNNVISSLIVSNNRDWFSSTMNVWSTLSLIGLLTWLLFDIELILFINNVLSRVLSIGLLLLAVKLISLSVILLLPVLLVKAFLLFCWYWILLVFWSSVNILFSI
jgi:hypothetical protein